MVRVGGLAGGHRLSGLDACFKPLARNTKMQTFKV